MTFEEGYSKGLALEGGAKANNFDTLEEAKKVANENKDKVKYITKTTLRGKVKYSLRKGGSLLKSPKGETSMKVDAPKQEEKQTEKPKKIKIFRTIKKDDDGEEEKKVVPMMVKDSGRRIKLRKKPKEALEKPKKKIKLKKKKKDEIKDEDDEEEEKQKKTEDKKMDMKVGSMDKKKIRVKNKVRDVSDKAQKVISKKIPKIPTSKSKITKPMKAVPTADDAMKRKKKKMKKKNY
jgi:hypothetical protein